MIIENGACEEEMRHRVGAGSTFVIEKGGCEERMRHRVGAGCGKWHEMSGIVCDNMLPIILQSAVFKTVIRPVQIYGIETWALRKAGQDWLESIEIGMLRWTMGKKRIEKTRNEETNTRAGVATVIESMRKARLRWLGHVSRKTEEVFFTGMDN